MGAYSGDILKMKQPTNKSSTQKPRMSKRGSWVGHLNVDEFEMEGSNVKRLSKRGSLYVDLSLSLSISINNTYTHIIRTHSVGSTEIKMEDVQAMVKSQRVSRRGSFGFNAKLKGGVI